MLSLGPSVLKKGHVSNTSQKKKKLKKKIVHSPNPPLSLQSSISPHLPPLPASTSFLLIPFNPFGRPMLSKNATLSSHSLSLRFLSQPSSSPMISLTLGRASSVACAFRNAS